MTTDFIKVVKEAMPPEMMEAFEADYIDVTFFVREDLGLAQCDRCGAIVGSPDLHRDWHRSLSLAIWLVQGWSLSHMKAHERDAGEED